MKDESNVIEAIYLFALYLGLLLGFFWRDGWLVTAMALLIVIKQLGRIRTAIERRGS